jgi:Na+/melibiose symporter-like transporter
MIELLRHRDARLLLTGETLSLLGDRAMFLALGIWVKSLTGSSAEAGLVFFAYALPGLLAPAAGLVADRVRRRTLLIANELAIVPPLLSLLFVHDRAQLWLIYLVAILYGASGTLSGSARSALLAEMLPSRILPQANAALQTASEGMRLVAPLAGAGLFAAFGGGAVACLDAATFVASAACLAALHHRAPRPVPHEHHLLKQVTAGVRHINRTPELRRVVVALGFSLLVVGFAETAIFSVVSQGLHRAPSFLGVLVSAQGVGAIAGALVAAPLLRRLGDGRFIALGLVFFAAGDGALVSSHVAVALTGIAIAGAGLSWALIGFGTTIQQRTPLDLQGRVYSAAELVLSVPQTLSIGFGALLVTVIDYRLLLVAIAVVVGASGAALAARSPGAHYTPPDAELDRPLGAGSGRGERAPGRVLADTAGERLHSDPQ